MLPVKAKNTPQVYWVIPPNSDHFEHDICVACTKFGKCIESVNRNHEVMRVIKLKAWDAGDSSLVSLNCFTTAGFEKYWQALDSAFQYNVDKKAEYDVRIALEKLQEKISTQVKEKPDKISLAVRGDGGSNSPEDFRDPMYRFFESFRCFDRFLWKRREALPTPP